METTIEKTKHTNMENKTKNNTQQQQVIGGKKTKNNNNNKTKNETQQQKVIHTASSFRHLLLFSSLYVTSNNVFPEKKKHLRQRGIGFNKKMRPTTHFYAINLFLGEKKHLRQRGIGLNNKSVNRKKVPWRSLDPRFGNTTK